LIWIIHREALAFVEHLIQLVQHMDDRG
jgi:hypothetical protein